MELVPDMLLRIGVGNFLSFLERQELSLVASSLSGRQEGLLASENRGHRTTGLPVSLVYGANASGKTNLVNALQFICRTVAHSHRAGDPEGGVRRTAFALSDQPENSPSTFDVDFLIEGVRYSFGFECDSHRVTKEWLYSYPENLPRKLYVRHENGSVEFGPSFRGAKATIQSVMRANSLFISAAVQNNHAELSRVAGFFSSITFDNEIAIAAPMLMYNLSTRKVDRRVMRFLDLMGTGIVGLEEHSKPIDEREAMLRRGIFQVLNDVLGKGEDVEDSEIPSEDKIYNFLHRGSSGKRIPFDIARESSGTRRLVLLLSSIFDSLDSGSVCVIDELDASLHTNAAETLVSLFTDPAINLKGAQLIATTHDTNLLMMESLRRDEIWFAEKSPEGSSSIYPLAEFSTRRSDNLEKGYLQGRFGALPTAPAFVEWLRSEVA